jgi:hypothetical protein
MFDQGGGRKASPKTVSETIGGGHSREYVEGKYGTITTR